ncbi:MAG: hypothetical protein KME47_10055 [Nodosilinea sp. WJT8-NPBG4]|jgi:hypothetical protein|nr:hypothetical protein [Nodosilinea sp. WJT8-NPBG4]
MTTPADKYKFTNVRFNRTNAFDTKALTTLDSLCKASGKSQTYIIKELLIRYGNAAMNTAVFDLTETGLTAPNQKQSNSTPVTPPSFSLDDVFDDRED